MDFQRYESVEEIKYSIDEILERIRSQFSYIRVQGLQSFLSLLNQYSKVDRNLLVEALEAAPEKRSVQLTVTLVSRILSPPKDADSLLSVVKNIELELGLQWILGLSLIVPSIKVNMREVNGIAALSRLIQVSDRTIPLLALDALLSVLIDSAANQQIFLRKNVLNDIFKLLKNKKTSKEIRYRCAVFLALSGGYLDERMIDTDASSGGYVPNYTVNVAPKILGLMNKLLPQPEKLMKPLLACAKPSEARHFVVLLDEVLGQ